MNGVFVDNVNCVCTVYVMILWCNHIIDTQPVREDNAEEVVKVLEEKHKDIAYGDIYSVLGGLELMVIVEDSPAASETTRRPHYE